MDPYKSVYGINFDVATELIAPGQQHLFGKCMLLPSLRRKRANQTGSSSGPHWNPERERRAAIPLVYGGLGPTLVVVKVFHSFPKTPTVIYLGRFYL